MSVNELTRSSILKAIEEFDSLGREQFLSKYGFGPAHQYYLEMDGKQYDSKAIAGVAYGHLENKRPLGSHEITGGQTIKKAFEFLGFQVSNSEYIKPLGLSNRGIPAIGTVLSNDEICTLFSVGNMGGMRRSKFRNHLVLISDPYKGLYQDRWVDGVLHYTGMGKVGDQKLSHSQNKTLAQSKLSGVNLHLLESYEKYRYTYLGEVELAGEPYEDSQFDEQQNLRKVCMFPLLLKSSQVPVIPTEQQVRNIRKEQSRIAATLTTEALGLRARVAQGKPPEKTVITTAYIRNIAVAEYVKRVAAGICDLCGHSAPFSNKQKIPYLECHHVVWLSRGGDDTIQNTVALCPNCHRRMHILDDNADKKILLKRAQNRLK